MFPMRVFWAVSWCFDRFPATHHLPTATAVDAAHHPPQLVDSALPLALSLFCTKVRTVLWPVSKLEATRARGAPNSYTKRITNSANAHRITQRHQKHSSNNLRPTSSSRSIASRTLMTNPCMTTTYAHSSQSAVIGSCWPGARGQSAPVATKYSRLACLQFFSKCMDSHFTQREYF
jgi:hypothetical protein